jgi:hypothetical protein
MNKYLIDYENAHWCGGQLYVVVEAENEYDAEDKASDWMETQQRELFADEYEEAFSDGETDFEEECAYTVNNVELLDENNKNWEFYKDPSQASFYPEI